jgi:hypothetical protein
MNNLNAQWCKVAIIACVIYLPLLKVSTTWRHESGCSLSCATGTYTNEFCFMAESDFWNTSVGLSYDSTVFHI